MSGGHKRWRVYIQWHPAGRANTTCCSTAATKHWHNRQQHGTSKCSFPRQGTYTNIRVPWDGGIASGAEERGALWESGWGAAAAAGGHDALPSRHPEESRATLATRPRQTTAQSEKTHAVWHFWAIFKMCGVFMKAHCHTKKKCLAKS